MNRDAGLYLIDVLESIKKIDKSTKTLTLKAFIKDVDIQDAIVRRLEVIGEATKHVPQEIKKKYPDIPWRETAGMRDKIVHDYFKINLEIVWNIVQNDLNPLKKQIKQLLKELDTK
jgi:uncharacterized protein with HEPN domain